ncbi:nuclease harbi1 [Elysia marginata]|uniref:Nuclease harbi1 n=1 Tax=Elysia marginata TaxID=1093978 RepID=A0AAV4IFY5_9GAST|nr:nuclease harbi1 [Elysia marginata]
MTPFRDNGHLTLLEKRYNSAQSFTRVDIERAFGLLKGKFRRLKELEMTKVQDIPNVIIICRLFYTILSLLRSGVDEDDIELENQEGERDDNLVNNANNQRMPNANAKRLNIAHLLI